MSQDSNSETTSADRLDRRKFIGAAAATAGAMFINPSLARGTAANSAIRVGLLGCGGRGTADASSLIETGGARIVALGDMFQDQLDAARANFDKIQQAKGHAALDPSQLFVGPNAYELIAASKEIDAIVVATPPYFHPQHLEAVVAAGKHVYLEKPVAVDVPGALHVIETGKRAEGKLSLDVGFQIRNCPLFVELVRRIHSGALGKIACGEAHYFAPHNDRPAWPNASPGERRLRNWIYDRVLSGDIILEQNIHAVDICNWVLQSHPIKASASGSRLGRPPDDGDVYGNYNVVFNYPGGIDVSFTSTQFGNGPWDVSERFFGTRGVSVSPYTGPLGIWGDEAWQAPLVPEEKKDDQNFSTTGSFHSNLEFADAEKKKAFLESITGGNFHNQAAAGAESALSCIPARSAAYEGRPYTWDEVLKSTEVWDSKIDLSKLS